MERVENTRQEILNIITSRKLTHEQKLTNLAGQADSLLEVLDLPDGLEDLLEPVEGKQCICDLFEGHAPVRPRYIVPDYAKFMREGSKFLQLDPPKDIYEALNSLLIFYKNVPSVTNYPVYLGNIDELLEPFMDDVDEAQAKKLFKLFFTHIDRTVLDSFSHADIGPKATRAGRLILEVERELLDAVPNITMKYDTDITPDDFGIECVKTALKTAKPSFANHKMFKKELGENYVIASCYNGLLLGGGSYTLCRLILGNIAKRAKDKKDFFENQLPYVMERMALYMDERIRFEVEDSGFFESNFLAKEGFIVLPYMYPDLVAARKLEDAGAAAIMPLGAPIGSNQGLRTKDFIRILIDEMKLPIIVDAGIGAPSQACEAMEMGAAAVMANTAVATAGDCAAMATAFRLAIEAGRLAYLSKLGRVLDKGAEASSPLTGFLQD